jgi:hypothetical protein
MSAQKHTTFDPAILQRICGEFSEMPGLRLTCAQAQRLWGLDEATCTEVLEFLVDARFLYQPRHGMYMRTADYDAGRVRRQLARAALEVHGQRLKDAG